MESARKEWKELARRLQILLKIEGATPVLGRSRGDTAKVGEKGLFQESLAPPCFASSPGKALQLSNTRHGEQGLSLA